MAGTKGTLIYTDGTEHRLAISSGDKMRTSREAAKPESEIGADQGERLLYSAYLAAKRAGLPNANESFLEWADHVEEFDVDITAEMIDTLLVSKEIDADQAELMRQHVRPVGDESGEVTATPTT